MKECVGPWHWGVLGVVYTDVYETSEKGFVNTKEFALSYLGKICKI
jgi:hypothetical protein